MKSQDEMIKAIAWIPQHPLFYERVNRHPSNHLLLNVQTPHSCETEASEMDSLEDRELTFSSLTA